ncbi:YoaK family protein [Patulibacter sp.]|uniref:YoaK family protein n=1 Tax=Patulibacter sp. TaxID=1912859 RepID=UPI00272877D5|nr:YoaK family protein [Patulibacter sp.]MDO9409804.1 YoaK family protein [Patulibacter sp.]
MRRPPGEPLVPVLVALTVATGMVDAVSFLGLGHVFTANMTGNVVFLGFGLSGGQGLSVAGAAVALAAFAAGAVLGGRLHVRSGDDPRRRLHGAMSVEAVLIAVAAALAVGLSVGTIDGRGYAVVAVLSLAMGVRNAVVRKLGVADMTTTVLTMTVTGLGADSAAAGGRPVRTARRLLSVAAMFAGALLGGLLVLGPGMATALAAAAVLVTATLAWSVLDRPAPAPAAA